MNLSLEPPSFVICYHCGFEGEVDDLTCPKCRRRVRELGYVRKLGVVLIVLSLIFGGAILYVISGFTETIEVSKIPGSMTKWNGNAAETGAVYRMLYGFVFLGATGIFAGLWHAVTGRVNKIVMYAFLGLAAATIAYAEITPLISVMSRH